MEHAAVAAVRAGTDTSCGSEFAKLTDAVKQGLIKESEIDQSVTRLFTARYPSRPLRSCLQRPLRADSIQPERLRGAPRPRPQSSGRVDGPTQERWRPALAKTVKTIAVIGPNAAALSAIEGNYNAVPSQPVVPLRGMERSLRQERDPLRSGLALCGRGFSACPTNCLAPRRRQHRRRTHRRVLQQLRPSGQTRGHTSRSADSTLIGTPLLLSPGIDLKGFSVRWTGALAVPVAGDYHLQLHSRALLSLPRR